MRIKVSILSVAMALGMALAAAPAMAQSLTSEGQGAVVNHNAGSQITGSAANLEAQARGSRFGIPGMANNYAFGPGRFYGR